MIPAMVTQRSFRRAIFLSLLVFFCCQSKAMERWAALSQLESGDNDYAVGTAGEVSRYQIKREVWKRYATSGHSWRNPLDSLNVAQEVMNDRCAAFERTFHRAPSDFEFYVLWNAPAQIHKPCRSVRQRADRFCQLMRKPESSS
jgi:hypothetical protein